MNFFLLYFSWHHFNKTWNQRVFFFFCCCWKLQLNKYKHLIYKTKTKTFCLLFQILWVTKTWKFKIIILPLSTNAQRKYYMFHIRSQRKTTFCLNINRKKFEMFFFSFSFNQKLIHGVMNVLCILYSKQKILKK